MPAAFIIFLWIFYSLGNAHDIDNYLSVLEKYPCKLFEPSPPFSKHLSRGFKTKFNHDTSLLLFIHRKIVTTDTNMSPRNMI